MTPRTADEMFAILYRFLFMRLYGDITTAARQGRLTEHDIARIESRALASIRTPEEFAAEFPDFDARLVARRVLDEFRHEITVTRTARIKDVSQKN